MAAVLLTFIGSMNVKAGIVDLTDNYRSGYCWNGEESISVGADGVITFNAKEWGGMAVWFGGQDWSMYESLTFEFAEPTPCGGGINIMDGGPWVGYDAGATSAVATLTGATVNNITQVALQAGADATLKIKRVYLTEAGRPDNDPAKFLNWVPNGDCARDYAEGETPSLIGKNGTGDNKGAFHWNFEEGKGLNGGRAMVVTSVDNPGEDWDAQFFVSAIGHTLSGGEQYKFRMAAKADSPINVGTQAHKEPGGYVHWACVGSFDLTSDWQSFESTGSIESAANGAWTAAFNLCKKGTSTANTFYFTNVEWWTNGPVWKGTQTLTNKPVNVLDKSLVSNLAVGDYVKVVVDGNDNVALTDASGDFIIAGKTYANADYVKFGITEKMLPMLQNSGINVTGFDMGMKSVSISENNSGVDFNDACWIGDYDLNGTAWIWVPAYEFDEADLGYTVDLRFDGAVTVNDLTVTFGGDYGIAISYAKDAERFKVAGSSVKLKIYSDAELNALKDKGLKVTGNVEGAALRAIVITPTLGTNSFNFINMKIATSNGSNAGDIIPENLDGANYFEVIDEVDGNGGEGSGAKLTITPDLDVDDYPAEVPAVSCFYKTAQGPQLRLSGGYNGVTLKIESTNAFNKLAFYQTNFSLNTKADKGILDVKNGEWTAGPGVTVNEVTFTLQADTTEVWKDGKLQEVILNDMGMWWIYQIEVDPISEVVIDAADGAELAALVADEMAKYAKPKSLTVNLAAGGNYTMAKAVEINVPFTLNGNGATVDASAVSGSSLFKMAKPLVEPNTKGFYELDNFTVKDATFKGVNYYIYDDNKNAVAFNEFAFTNCLFELTNNKQDIDCPFRFQAGGPVKFVLTNSTMYQKGTYNYKYFVKISSGNFPDKAFAEFAGPYVWQVENNTFYKCLTDKMEFINGGRVGNNYKKTSITLKNNIFYDCSKGDGFLKNLFGSKSSDKDLADFVSIATGNNTYFADGAAVPAHGSKYDKGTILETDPGFKNAAGGDFTLDSASDQFKNKTGDPRWLSGKGAGEATGIDTVKEAQVEDGEWYTIQGVRVAQPTKGLYIHNGKKVVIK